MGKSDEKKTKERARKPTNGESKHKNKNTPRFNIDGGLRRSQWRNHFRQICEYKIQFGHCIVPQQYSTNPKLGQWVSRQRRNYRKHTEEEATSMKAEHIRALDGIGFDWGTKRPDSASNWNERFEHNCVNASYSLVTASCHNSILPTPNSGGGFRGSAGTTESTRKKRQLL